MVCPFLITAPFGKLDFVDSWSFHTPSISPFPTYRAAVQPCPGQDAGSRVCGEQVFSMQLGPFQCFQFHCNMT